MNRKIRPQIERLILSSTIYFETKVQFILIALLRSGVRNAGGRVIVLILLLRLVLLRLFLLLILVLLLRLVLLLGLLLLRVAVWLIGRAYTCGFTRLVLVLRAAAFLQGLSLRAWARLRRIRGSFRLVTLLLLLVLLLRLNWLFGLNPCQAKLLAHHLAYL